MKTLFRKPILQLILVLAALFTVSSIRSFSQDQPASQAEGFRPFSTLGFNLLMHNGIYGSTVPARPVGGEYNPNGGDPYTGLGFGINFNYRILEFASIYADINNYSSLTPVAYKDGYASSDWVWEMNDYNVREVGPFPENANYWINTTGFRLGVRIYPLRNARFQPWYGIYYGYYNTTFGVFSEDKKTAYGKLTVETFSPTILNIGVDFWDKSRTFSATVFAEFGAPVARDYAIENCLHTGWTFRDYGEGFHLFGYNRIGISVNMNSGKK